jgi:transposase
MPKPGQRTRSKYSDRFKATAVRLSELPGVEVQDVAESLYILPSCCLVGASKRARDRS